MKYELHLHRIALGIIVLLLSVAITYGVYWRQHYGQAGSDAVLAILIVTMSAALFVAVGIVESAIAFQFGKGHRRELIAYLIFGLISLGSGLYLAISNAGSLQSVGLVASPYALMFGLAEIRAARHCTRHRKYKVALRIGGVLECAAGAALIFSSFRIGDYVVDLLICVALITVLQLAVFVFVRLPHAQYLS